MSHSKRLLRSVDRYELQWILAQSVESIAFINPTPQQLSVLSGEVFDPLSGQAEPGKLSLSREINELEFKIAKVLQKTVKMILGNRQNGVSNEDEALQVAVMRAAAAIFVLIVENKFNEDFARQEMNRVLDQVILNTSNEARVAIKSGTLEIDCPWKDPRHRWTVDAMWEAINKLF